MRLPAPWLAMVPVISSIAIGGCKRGVDPDDVGSAPPPAPSTKPGVCAGGGGTPSDPVSAAFFPRTVGDYCVDPNGDARAYGDEAKSSLDDVCTEQLDGECEVYKSYGLKRLVMMRYVDGKGTPGAVAITLSRFATKEGAFGFFTKRVVADGDPLRITLSPIQAGAAGALGSGIAYVWRGEHLAELSYTNEAEPPQKMRESAKAVLPDLARAVGDKLAGDTAPPPAVVDLPIPHRIPMGITVTVGNLLGIAGVGNGATGFYKDADKRWRVVALERRDEDAAKDVLETLKKGAHASSIKDLGFPALAFSAQETDASPRTDWVAASVKERVFGVGDEELVLGGTTTKDDEQRTKLGRDEKIALLRKLVAGGS